jgi:hypothetical protein
MGKWLTYLQAILSLWCRRCDDIQRRCDQVDLDGHSFRRQSQAGTKRRLDGIDTLVCEAAHLGYMMSFFLKKGCPGRGANPGTFDLVYFLIPSLYH